MTDGRAVTDGKGSTFATPAARWAAVERRDPAADGAFYYSVRTTGVYCNPSCGSRRARRDRVRFHATRAHAERAGFRPCRRCRPDQAPPLVRRAAVVTAACRQIERAGEVPQLDRLAANAGMSRRHFHRVFTEMTGLTPRAYAAEARAGRVRRALTRDRRVTDVIYEAGFGSNGRFYANTTRFLGMSPTRFRAGGAGVQIRFAVGRSSLGSILVAATDRGVCAVSLGDNPEALVRDLQETFGDARLTGGDRSFDRWVAQVVGFVEAPDRGLDLPLDVQGTAFQRRVWRALAAIPIGTTTSYGEIARRTGSPAAARAVARACAANPAALAIPCHRVVRTDGALGGYRWGVARKQALLVRERTARRSGRVGSDRRSGRER